MLIKFDVFFLLYHSFLPVLLYLENNSNSVPPTLEIASVCILLYIPIYLFKYNSLFDYFSDLKKIHTTNLENTKR